MVQKSFKFVVVLIVLSLIVSLLSIILNLLVFNSQNSPSLNSHILGKNYKTYSAGQLGFIVESSSSQSSGLTGAK